MGYTVVRDTREKSGKGWLFTPGDVCDGTLISGLKTGDYSLLGYEHLFAVERKGSVEEFVANLTQKEKWADFKAELIRMEAVQASFIILEFTLDAMMAYPEGTSIPLAVRDKIRVTPAFYLQRFLEIELAFTTKIIPAGKQGRACFSSLCKRIVEKWPVPTPPA